MPINAHPDFLAAEKEYHLAYWPEEKLKALEKMISLAPKHKGAENLRAQLKTRYKSLKDKIEKNKKSKKSSKQGIKKEDMQAVIIGFTNSGKSLLLSSLTNANPKISPIESAKFTTKKPEIGILEYSPGVQVQLIEVPAIDSDFYDRGIVNTADTIIVLVTEMKQIEEIKKILEKARGKRIILFNKSDLLSNQNKRKISETLKSKRYNFEIISAKTKEGFDPLKEKLLKSFDKMRIYTKEPGKEKTERALILEEGSNVKDVAEKVLRGFSKNVKETKIWGPSSKFPGQKVGMNHNLKDMDIVEFKTK